MRDGSEKSIPPKILKEEGTEMPEGKSCVPVMQDVILTPSRLTASAVPQRLFLAFSVFSVVVMGSLVWCVQLESPKTACQGWCHQVPCERCSPAGLGFLLSLCPCAFLSRVAETSRCLRAASRHWPGQGRDLPQADCAERGRGSQPALLRGDTRHCGRGHGLPPRLPAPQANHAAPGAAAGEGSLA